MNTNKMFIIHFEAIIPGLVFIFISILSLICPLVLIHQNLFEKYHLILMPFTNYNIINNISNSVLLIIINLLLLVSYLVGILFFQSSTALADKYSIKYLFQKSYLESWLIRKDECGIDMQYPYQYLYEYLLERNLQHLTKYVPWIGSNPITHHLRSKFLIQKFKIRIQYSCPDSFIEIARLSSKVLLFSSIWSVARISVSLCIIGIVLLLISLLLNYLNILYYSNEIPILMIFLYQIGIILYVTKKRIQKSFHFLRVRELITILEYYHLANISKI